MVVCGVMFVLGLISIFTSHVASDLEWCSQRVVIRRLLNRRLLLVARSRFGCKKPSIQCLPPKPCNDGRI
ncbi:hypothetical protein Hanom_Chr00s000001g01594171 [Helianthus anomalus]